MEPFIVTIQLRSRCQRYWLMSLTLAPSLLFFSVGLKPGPRPVYLPAEEDKENVDQGDSPARAPVLSKKAFEASSKEEANLAAAGKKPRKRVGIADTVQCFQEEAGEGEGPKAATCEEKPLGRLWGISRRTCF